jgi:hypothetical protein
MIYPIPSIPEAAHSTDLTFLEMCTYGLIRMDNDEACINIHAAKIGHTCSLKQLGFTKSESYIFLQYLCSLAKIVEKRRGFIFNTFKPDLPF